MKALSWGAVALMAVLAAGGCSGAARDAHSSGSKGGSGTGSDNDSPSEGGRPGSGAGGASAGGSQGSVDGGEPSFDVTCKLQIGGLSVTSLSRVVAGPEATVTVQARTTPGVTAAPTSFSWSVRLDNETIATEPSGTSEFTFPVKTPGKYSVDLKADLEGSACRVSITVLAVSKSERATDLWLRVIPPAASGLVPHEESLRLTSSQPLTTPVRLKPARQVVIQTKTSSPLSLIIPSFVRLTSKTSTFRWEIHTIDPNNVVQAYMAQLDPFLEYEVLVVPEGNFAPFMLQGRQNADTLNATPIKVLAGTPVKGEITNSGSAVAGARILLRSGDTPSTLGTSNAAGAFSILSSKGTFGATIRGADQTDLPDLTLSEAEGIVVPEDGTVSGVKVQWNDLPSVEVVIRVVSPNGSDPVADAEVQLEIVKELPNGGTLTIAGGPPRPLSAKVLRRKTTGANGAVTFANVPHGEYRVQLTPTRTPGLARTREPLTVTAATGTAVLKVASSVMIRGTLQPAAAATGAMVQAFNSEAPAELPIVATVASDGTYALSVSPYRTYVLRVVPLIASGHPVAPMQTVGVAGVDKNMQPWTLASATRIEGTVTTNLNAGLAGGIVQIFCLDEQRKDCICPAATGSCPAGSNATTAVPLAEVLTDSVGHFKLLAVDPTSF